MATAVTPAQAFRDLDDLVHRISDVSSLPHVICQIIAVTQNPLADVRDITEAIEADPAIAARVMRCVNSVAHGKRHTITSLKQAVSYLGYSQVRNLVITGAVCGVFQKGGSIGAYQRSALWRHVAAVAVTARMIAEQRRLADPDEVYLAGLLHDLGIILEDQFLHEKFAAMMRERPLDKPQADVERDFLGFDHAMLGSCVAQKWGLSEGVVEAIRYHHATRYNGPHARLIACVELANVLCSSMGFQSTGAPLPPMSPSVIEHLRIGPSDVRPLIAKMKTVLAEYEGIFRIEAAA